MPNPFCQPDLRHTGTGVGDSAEGAAASEPHIVHLAKCILEQHKQQEQTQHGEPLLHSTINGQEANSLFNHGQSIDGTHVNEHGTNGVSTNRDGTHPTDGNSATGLSDHSFSNENVSNSSSTSRQYETSEVRAIFATIGDLGSGRDLTSWRLAGMRPRSHSWS